MKKSFPVHIEGRIYYFDEDAYERLNRYYDNLHQAFTDEDGAEIVADIEARVAEILSEKQPVNEFTVVTIEDIDRIITRMGNPEELADTPDVSHQSTETHTTPPPYQGLGNSATPPEVPVKKKFYRDMNNKVIAGVLSGLSHYLGINVTGLRIAVVLLGLFTWMGPFVLAYIVAWLIIPAAVSPRQILEMNGENVSVNTIGRTTIQGTHTTQGVGSDGGFWKTAARVIGVCMMSFLGLMGGVLTIAMLFLLVMNLVGFVTYLGWGDLDFVPTNGTPLLSLTAMLVTIIAVLIPSAAAVWATCCTLFKIKGVKRHTAIKIAIIEVVLIIAAISLCSILHNGGSFAVHYKFLAHPAQIYPPSAIIC